MPDREKVIKGLERCSNIDMCCMEISCFHPKYLECPYYEEEECVKLLVKDSLELLNEQSNCENCAMAIEDRQIVRCKDCVHRGDKHKCILAFVADKQDFPYFFYDNHGKWFCADGKRRAE